MKNIISFVFYLFVVLVITSCEKAEPLAPGFYDCHFNSEDKSLQNPDGGKYQQLLNEMTQQGVPGVMMAIKTSESATWIGASGMADIANHIPLKKCNISRAGSIAKTFTAVTILMLAEEGKLHLDDKATLYLPAPLLNKLQNANEATIRQLLNHTSGIYNYIQNLKFQTASLNHLTKVWRPEELLRYAYHQKAYFKPGEDVYYSNTNYILLGLIIEQVTNKPFAEVFEEKIFNPLHLTSTSFNINDPIPSGLARGYVDLYSDLNIIESTRYSGWDYYTADGGLISNPYDLSVIIEALFSGKLLNEQSLSQMQQWQKPQKSDSDFFPIEYGLGIFRIVTPYGNAVYHSGDAIGYYGCMMYFPQKKISICWQTNGNYGKIDRLISSKEAMMKIFETVF